MLRSIHFVGGTKTPFDPCNAKKNHNKGTKHQKKKARERNRVLGRPCPDWGGGGLSIKYNYHDTTGEKTCDFLYSVQFGCMFDTSIFVEDFDKN